MGPSHLCAWDISLSLPHTPLFPPLESGQGGQAQRAPKKTEGPSPLEVSQPYFSRPQTGVVSPGANVEGTPLKKKVSARELVPEALEARLSSVLSRELRTALMWNRGDNGNWGEGDLMLLF